MTGCPPPMESPVIEITLQPTATINVTVSNITGTLSVEATATGGVKLNYQWYSNTTNSYSGSTAIAGATSAGYKIPATLAAGTYYYYCEVYTADKITTVRTKITRVNVAAMVAVTGITGLATTGTTGATITGNTLTGSILNTTAAGTVTVLATIPNGTAVGTEFTQSFCI